MTFNVDAPIILFIEIISGIKIIERKEAALTRPADERHWNIIVMKLKK